jgi:hypothetical protein
MGFYLRKSVNVGGFRFNLSKSGVGMSVGVKGLRFGTGPRGNYVQMGRGGVYFRQTLSPRHTVQTIPRSQPIAPMAPPTAPIRAMEPPLAPIESASVVELVDGSADDLIRDINDKRRRLPLFPFIAVLGCLGLIALIGVGAYWWLTLATFIVSVAAVVMARQYDEVNKSVVLLYGLDEAAQDAYQGFQDAFGTLASCARIWQVHAQGQSFDRKYTAGANTIERRAPITLSKGRVANLKTNIDIPKIPAGKQTLAFLPDRLLVFEPSAVGAISYDQISIYASRVNFREQERLPGDAVVTGYTWQYVNKNGGPDRRFSRNPLDVGTTPRDTAHTLLEFDIATDAVPAELIIRGSSYVDAVYYNLKK